VADFLGGTNFLPGVVQAVGVDAMLVVLDVGVTLRAAPTRNQGFSVGETVLVCLRPEAPRVEAPGSDAGSANVLIGTLGLTQYMGQVTAAEVELSGGHVIRVQTARARGGSLPAQGSRVAVQIDPQDVLILKRPS